MGSYVCSYVYPRIDDGAVLQVGTPSFPAAPNLFLAVIANPPKLARPFVLLAVHAQSVTGLLPPTVVQQALQAAKYVPVALHGSDAHIPNVSRANFSVRQSFVSDAVRSGTWAWAAVTAWGHEDAPVSWVGKAHGYLLQGDHTATAVVADGGRTQITYLAAGPADNV